MRSKPFIFLNKNSKFYKLRYYDNGNPKTISTGLEDYDAADIWGKKFLENPQLILNPVKPVLLSTFVEDIFLPSKSYNKKTADVFRSSSRLIISVIGDKFISQYSKDDFNNYIDKRSGTISDYTLKGNIRNMNVILNFAVMENYIKENPLIRAKKVKAKKIKIVYFTYADFKKLISVIDNELIKDITFVAVYTGMRLGEILNLKPKDVSLEKRIMFNYQNKVDEFNTISIANDIFEIIERNYNKGNDYIFTSGKSNKKVSVWNVSSAFRKYVDKAGLPSTYSFKILRKTFGSWLLQSGVDLNKVSHLLGHSDIRITKKHYADYSEDYDNTVNLIKYK